MPRFCSRGVKTPVIHLYWIVSDVVDARSFVMRILTMLKRNTKLIWREGRQKRKDREVGNALRGSHFPP